MLCTCGLIVYGSTATTVAAVDLHCSRTLLNGSKERHGPSSPVAGRINVLAQRCLTDQHRKLRERKPS